MGLFSGMERINFFIEEIVVLLYTMNTLTAWLYDEPDYKGVVSMESLREISARCWEKERKTQLTRLKKQIELRTTREMLVQAARRGTTFIRVFYHPHNKINWVEETQKIVDGINAKMNLKLKVKPGGRTNIMYQTDYYVRISWEI